MAESVEMLVGTERRRLRVDADAGLFEDLAADRIGLGLSCVDAT